MPNVTSGCAPTAFIEAVVVRPSHRRRGIAKAMLQRILTDARVAGCNKVRLLSHKRHASDGAHRRYTSLGFEPEAEGLRLSPDRESGAPADQRQVAAAARVLTLRARACS